MHPYALLLAGSCLVNALCAGLLLARDTRPEGRVSAAVLAGAAFWALCELAWNTATDAGTALAWMRLSAAGWIFIGPSVLQVMLGGARERPAWLRALPAVYAFFAIFLVLTWTTPWMLAGAVRTGWGWGYVVGPVYPVYWALTGLAIAVGYTRVTAIFSIASEADRRQRPWVVAGMMLPLLVASTTDSLLPVLDVQVPRLATSSFAALGLITVSNVFHFGYSMISPGNFSEELLANLREGLALLHPRGRIRTANEGLARLTGMSRRQLESLSIHEILSRRLDEDEEIEEEEAQLRTVSGAATPVAVSSRMLRDRQGYRVGLVVTVRDLREVTVLRSRLLTADRMAAVGQLAAGIAHEINNPLAFVRSNLSLLQDGWKQLAPSLRRAELSPELRELCNEGGELIEESIDGVDRAAEIVRSVRDFSHAGTPEREEADLHALLDHVLVIAGPQMRGRIEVTRSYGALEPVRCAPQQLKQVFLNLVVNAIQAMEERGTLRIATRAEQGFAEIDVEDDGCGIPPEIQERIFDPFFTTKAVGEGTGLGLGIAYQIVSAHGGTLSVRSQPRRGSRFRVRLPMQGAPER